MNYITASYCENFKCIGSRCSDNCCIGWEIDIDSKTLEYYKTVKDTFGEKLKKCICEKEQPHFILAKDERCPFLNDENLCEIIINLGEEHLCEICNEHPRFYNWFNDRTEMGIGLCCEEASRLLFSNESKLEFNERKSDFKGKIIDDYDENLLKELILARKFIVEILQNRNFSIDERIYLVLLVGEVLDEELEKIILGENQILNFSKIEEKFTEDRLKLYLNSRKLDDDLKLELKHDMLEFFASLEPLDCDYPRYLKSLNHNYSAKKFDENYKNALEFEYEHLLVYFVYRYFIKGVFDLEVGTKIRLAILSFMLIRQTDIFEFENKKNFTLQDRINIVKRYSQEIEYSDENVEATYDFCYDYSDVFLMINYD